MNKNAHNSIRYTAVWSRASTSQAASTEGRTSVPFVFGHRTAAVKGNPLSPSTTGLGASIACTFPANNP